MTKTIRPDKACTCTTAPSTPGLNDPAQEPEAYSGNLHIENRVLGYIIV